MKINIPYSSCDICANTGHEGKIYLEVERRGFWINQLELRCASCEWKVELLEAMKDQPKEASKKARRISKDIVRMLVSMKSNIPKDREGLRAAIRDPTHPFTASVLTGLLLLAMELSGFGVFMLVTWVLGNLILNPAGWVLLPIVVAIAFAFRRYFTRQNLERLRMANQKLVEQLQRQEIDQEEFNQLQKQLFDDYIKRGYKSTIETDSGS